MRYNFDVRTDRRGTNSLKWDVTEGELPMWVADMDFQTAPEIKEAILKRAEHGIFGYTVIPDEWYHAYIQWWEKRHDFRMEKEWMIFTTGVMPAVSSAVRKLTGVGENVLIQTPVYNMFFQVIANNGRNVVEAPLKYDGENYHIDFGELEKKLSNPQTTMMILCNPHNPVGKIWDRETLAEIGELCCRHHVTVLSDEIHCDLTAPGWGYIPFASVSDTCRDISVTCIAPTKTFNLAGIHTAAVVAADEVLRHKMRQTLNTDEASEPNAFAVDAAVAAFTRGEPWLDELREYIWENKRMVSEFLAAHVSEIKAVPSKATYLIWLDCGCLVGTGREIGRYLREKTGLYLSGGSQYGKCGEDFLRMNVACPRSQVEEALGRMQEGIAAYTQWAGSLC
ncbi:MAG: pyridoxal phosphate-dependent aminotransferase [Lachnospiraceae bacterium]|nr:pyridoxal phosphate-dependent aminotransferase [Lachnospiraceae bacterium]